MYSVVGRLFVRVGGYMRFEKGKDVWSPVFFACSSVIYLLLADVGLFANKCVTRL